MKHMYNIDFSGTQESNLTQQVGYIKQSIKGKRIYVYERYCSLRFVLKDTRRYNNEV